jgi:formamidopyrimidine-DNA glycosylase
MPELPEVETIRRQMQGALVGEKIVDVEVRFAGRLNVPAKMFVETVKGASFASFGRRAKLLLVNLDNDWTIVTHLKMTGQYMLTDGQKQPGKHTHVVFRLKSGRVLFFEDVRKFGYLKLVRTADLEEKIFAREGYGPEPLDPGFTFAKFKMCLTARPNKKIKPLLMDQGCIAGIGNIYADEACWYGRTRPTRRVGSLTDKELRGIFQGARVSMLRALKARGTSADSYRDLYGEAGEFVPKLKVYDRTGQKCQRCGGVIKKIWIGSRSAHFCERCQK